VTPPVPGWMKVLIAAIAVIYGVVLIAALVPHNS
jgi:hypothetical protein